MFLKSHQASLPVGVQNVLLPVGVQKVIFTEEKMLVVMKKNLNWRSARQECKKLGGDLASLSSETELDQLAQTLNVKNPGGNVGVWLGAQLVDHEDPTQKWKWITGETLPADSDKWRSGQRDDGERCLVIYWNEGSPYHGKLYSLDCTVKRAYYVCQFM